MGELKPEPLRAICPTVKPSVNGGASGTPTTWIFQPIDTIKFSSDANQVHANQVPITENLQTSQNTEKVPRGDKWDFDEDVALMSAWCVTSGDQVYKKTNKKRKMSMWARIKELYDEAQAKNPEKLRLRNENQIRGRWKRLNENAVKWIHAYRKAYKEKTSEMSLKDIENEAHKIYAACGSTYNDLIVYNEVMCKHPKWKLDRHCDATCSCRENEVGNGENEVGNDESGDSSTKRTKTSEEEDYCVIFNEKMPNSNDSTINRPTGRDASEKKGKSKVSQYSSFRKEFVAELCATRITRDSEVEVMRKRLDLEHRKEERKLKKEERKSKKMYYTLLNTLLAKEHLSPEDKDLKHHLLAKLYEK